MYRVLPTLWLLLTLIDYIYEIYIHTYIIIVPTIQRLMIILGICAQCRNVVSLKHKLKTMTKIKHETEDGEKRK